MASVAKKIKGKGEKKDAKKKPTSGFISQAVRIT